MNPRHRKPKIHVLYKNGVEVARGTVKEIATQTGLSVNYLYKRKKAKDTPNGRRVTVRLDKNEFALYQGDECIMSGTAEEIAKSIGVQAETVCFYSTDAHAKRVEATYERMKNHVHYKVVELGMYAY